MCDTAGADEIPCEPTARKFDTEADRNASWIDACEMRKMLWVACSFVTVVASLSVRSVHSLILVSSQAVNHSA